jgi:hypothetical protein
MILFLPHYGIGGGAGEYIKNICNDISSYGEVFFSGKYKKEYSGEVIDKGLFFDFFFNSFIIPFYSGVTFFTILCYVFKAIIIYPFIVLFSFYLKRKCEKKESVKIIFLTSIVQAPQVLIIKLFFPKSKLVLIIQENIILNGVLGEVCVFLIRRFDVVVSINSLCHERLKGVGIESIIVLNKFSDEVNNFNTDDIIYDAVYVGGEQKIKGFKTVLDAFEIMSEENDITLVMLGHYGDAALRKINSINELNEKKGRKSHITVLGSVDSCSEAYKKSKFLILPINAAHFCRPAIEVGLLRKTFLVTSFDGLSDFALPNYNCISFEVNNLNSFILCFKSLLDEGFRSELEEKNFLFSSAFRSNYSLNNLILKLGV